MGPNWAFSYDTRIIRGYDAGYAEYAQEIRRLSSDTFDRWNKANSDYSAAVTALNRALRAVEAAITEAENLLSAAGDAMGSASQIKDAVTRSSKVSAAQQRISTASSLLNGVKAEKQKILSALAELSTSVPTIQSIRRIYGSLNSSALQAEREKAHGDVQVYLNRSSSFTGDPSHLAETGLNTITLVDEKGAPHIYNVDTSPNYSSNTTYSNGKTNYYPLGSTLTPVIPTAEKLILLSDGSITRTLEDQTVYTYSLYGILQSIRDRNGNTILLEYENGKLSRITDGAGRIVDVDWNVNGKIIKLTDPLAREAAFTYTTGDRIASVTDSVGDSIRYTYQADRLVRITKPDESYRVFHWQQIAGEWRCVQVDDELRNPEYFSYTHSAGYIQRTDYTNPSGVLTRHYLNEDQLETKIEYADGTQIIKEYDADMITLRGLPTAGAG